MSPSDDDAMMNDLADRLSRTDSSLTSMVTRDVGAVGFRRRGGGELERARADSMIDMGRRLAAVVGVALLALAASCSSGPEGAGSTDSAAPSTSPASRPTDSPSAASTAQPATSGGPSTTQAGSTTGPVPASTSPVSTSSTSPTSSTAPQPNADFTFPVAVSENGRYLVDENGDPWMMVGDSPQCMPGNLSVDDMRYFFADRASFGFNAAWVNLICGPYTYGRDDASTWDGITPFLEPKDLSTPNPEYWERMDEMVDLAKSYGITLVLDPAETGSFSDWLRDNGADKSRGYGEFLGERYASDVNIIWMLGNDYGFWSQYDEYLVALRDGLRTADPSKLITIELNPPVSTSFDDEVWPPLIDLNAAYSYTPTYDIVRRAYNETPTMPVFMVEANYEFENNDGGPETNDVALRRQAYWTMTSGATGQLYGNKYTWGFDNAAWKDSFDTKAVAEYQLMADFFAARRWWDLVPDEQGSILTGGGGDYASTGDVLDNTYATAASTPDGTLAVVYVPTARTVEIDTSRLAAGVSARWFDPTDGSYRPAAAPFTTPGANAAGDDDWVLVFEQISG